jgi:hypothetical protein
MSESMNKVECIRAMLAAGREKDLLDFVEGESTYLSDASCGAPQTAEQKRMWVLLVHHLRFLTSYGNTVTKVIDGGKYLSAHPESLNEWLDLGAPGIAEEDISAYLKANPL